MLELSTLFLEGSRYRRKSSMADPTFEAAESYERASPNHTASLGPPPSCNQHQSFGQAALALRHHLAPPCPSLACLFGYRAWMSNEPLSNQHLVMALHSHLRASWSQPERKTAVDRPAARHRIMVNHVPCPLLHGTWLLPLHQEDEQHNDAPLCTDNYSLPTNGPRCNFLTRLPVRGPPRQPEPDDETTSPPGTSYLPLSLCLRRIALCQQPTTSRPSGSFVACHNLARIDEQSGPV
ncbi:hypothetical protein IWX50DRAFT_403320 [Phyllosticta citricarpa]|uniref:Uncharacterized protein n=1 Tax=Phyllosticta citricarpa TaxID=55181 RepID=A0ABR1L731_9PEZI